MRSQTAGSSRDDSRDTAAFVRSLASVYWARSLVPMLTKSTSPAKSAARIAAAGTSTMMPTGNSTGPSPARASSRTPRAQLTSSGRVTIGNITRIGVSRAAIAMPRSCSANRSRALRIVRMPRSPSAGLGSRLGVKKATGLSPPASQVRIDSGPPMVLPSAT